jgi:hypothetical protein
MYPFGCQPEDRMAGIVSRCKRCNNLSRTVWPDMQSPFAPLKAPKAHWSNCKGCSYTRKRAPHDPDTQTSLAGLAVAQDMKVRWTVFCRGEGIPFRGGLSEISHNMHDIIYRALETQLMVDILALNAIAMEFFKSRK